jgi:hypothetical protein
MTALTPVPRFPRYGHADPRYVACARSSTTAAGTDWLKYILVSNASLGVACECGRAACARRNQNSCREFGGPAASLLMACFIRVLLHLTAKAAAAP